MQRITQLSKQNLMIAERVEIVPAFGGALMLKVWRGERSGFVAGSWGPLTWENVPALRRFLRRFRADLADALVSI